MALVRFGAVIILTLMCFNNQAAAADLSAAPQGADNPEVIERAVRIASSGSTGEMKAFLEEGHDINAFYGGETLLHNAVRDSRDIRKINMLIKNGADVNKTSGDGFTPLVYAMQAQDSIFAEMAADAFKNKTQINEKQYIQKTEKTLLPILELLIRNGADINGNSSLGTPLHMAASGSSPVILYYLLDKGANPNIRDAKGNTPLFSAASADKTKNIEILLKFGANPEIRNKDGRTYSYYLTHKIFRYKP